MDLEATRKSKLVEIFAELEINIPEAEPINKLQEFREAKMLQSELDLPSDLLKRIF